jgi:cytoskeletal protein CcmA (bactofilin family)
MSGGAAASPNESNAADMNFFVSGTVGSKNSATIRGTAVFGGDLHVSGNLTIDGSGGGGSIDGAGGATRLAYWADADTLMYNSGLHGSKEK